MAKKDKKKKGKPNKPAPKLPPDERLLALYETAPAPTGPLVTSVKVFGPFLTLTRAYLESNRYSDSARHFVAEMAFQFRQEAFRRFKHDTVETFELARLLKPAAEAQEKIGRKDAVSHIMGYPSQRMRLGDEQLDAAEQIIKVWKALGKGIDGSGGRDLSRGGGGSGRNLHPMDTMDEELYIHYKTVYTPWHNTGARLGIGRKHNGDPVTVAAIVYNILIGDIYPEQLDKGFNLRQGLSLYVLQQALSCYECPARMRKRIAPPKPSAPPARSAAQPVIKAVAAIPRPKAKTRS